MARATSASARMSERAARARITNVSATVFTGHRHVIPTMVVHKRASSTREATRSKLCAVSSATGAAATAEAPSARSHSLKQSHPPHITNPPSASCTRTTSAFSTSSMSRLPFRLTAASAGEVEKQEFQHADAAHQLLDRDQAAGLFAQLAMHGRSEEHTSELQSH